MVHRNTLIKQTLLSQLYMAKLLTLNHSLIAQIELIHGRDLLLKSCHVYIVHALVTVWLWPYMYQMSCDECIHIIMQEHVPLNLLVVIATVVASVC